MAEEKKDWTPTIIAAVIGVAFIGFQQQQKNNADNVGNLPATNANVETNAQAIIDLRDQLTTQIDAARTSASSALAGEAQLIRSEINRRETETIKYIDTLDGKKSERVSGLEARVMRTEEMFFDHVNTPSAQHMR